MVATERERDLTSPLISIGSRPALLYSALLSIYIYINIHKYVYAVCVHTFTCMHISSQQWSCVFGVPGSYDRSIDRMVGRLVSRSVGWLFDTDKRCTRPIYIYVYRKQMFGSLNWTELKCKKKKEKDKEKEKESWRVRGSRSMIMTTITNAISSSALLNPQELVGILRSVDGAGSSAIDQNRTHCHTTTVYFI